MPEFYAYADIGEVCLLKKDGDAWFLLSAERRDPESILATPIWEPCSTPKASEIMPLAEVK